jgi:NAD(P)-dependent dehydrogenase (short-subunit alcohol dehydrogenase family)
VSKHQRKVALITGSTSGIGAAIARRLSAEGFSTLLHSRASVDAGRALAAELGNAIYLQADLSVETARCKLVAEAFERWGRLDVLVNNAGLSRGHCGNRSHADSIELSNGRNHTRRWWT